MLALSPTPLFSLSNGWTLEDIVSPRSHQNGDARDVNNISRDIKTSSDFLLPSSSNSSGQEKDTNGESAPMSKKNNHNASERYRRKRVNDLYSSLRSLLPAAEQTKKLSIPGTVSSVLKYIPELQKEVEGLVHKKEQLQKRISRQDQTNVHLKKKQKYAVTSPTFAISVIRLGDREVLVQISAVKLMINKSLLFEVLELLEEEDGLLLLNASSFKSLGDRAFNSLHLQVEGNKNVDTETLREKLLSICEKTQVHFL